MHMSLSRQYYAHRHGYAYQHLVSEAHAYYFGDNFLDVSAFAVLLIEGVYVSLYSVVRIMNYCTAVPCTIVSSVLTLSISFHRQCPPWESPTKRMFCPRFP